MERWAARGLELLTGRAEEGPPLQPPRDGPGCETRREDAAGRGVEREEAGAGAADAPRDLPPPPSPRTQALLDSDLLCALLSCTVERGLAPSGGPQACHALFCGEQGSDSPSHTPARSFDEDDALSHASETWQTHTEHSPTSTVWSEWDAESPKQAARGVSLGRKRRREECDGGERDWETEDQLRWAGGLRRAP
eukprot:Tamp_22162.p2 GENE.Tamp_22162~~Tamp_22162.p2  ORF type:complete len:222 (+),score=36.04 Tamp_22162:85-666(+)